MYVCILADDTAIVAEWKETLSNIFYQPIKCSENKLMPANLTKTFYIHWGHNPLKLSKNDKNNILWKYIISSVKFIAEFNSEVIFLITYLIFEVSLILWGYVEEKYFKIVSKVF